MGPGEQKAGWRPVLNACTCASISVAMGLRALLFASLMQCCNIKKKFFNSLQLAPVGRSASLSDPGNMLK